VRVVVGSKKLNEFDLPLKVEGNPSHLELEEFLKANRQKSRGLLKKLSDLPVCLETYSAKRMIKAMQKQASSFKFDINYAHTDLYNELVNEIFAYYSAAFVKPMNKAHTKSEFPLLDTNLVFPAEQMVVRSRALLRTVDQMYFKPGKGDDTLTFDLRKLFILASNRAQQEIILFEGLFANDSEHKALSRFEGLTQKTLHYNLEIARKHTKPLTAFMPVQSHKLDWQDEYLKAVSEIFHLSKDEAESLIENFGLFDEPRVKVGGFARTSFTMPYLM
jgi:hypothetical protein